MSLIVLIIVAISYSCTEPPQVIPEYSIITGMDFTKYSNQGFLFTPDKYEADYESVGLISMTYRPRAELKVLTGDTTSHPELKAIYEKGVGGAPYQEKREWQYEILSEEFLDEVYEACVGMGADALTQMEFSVSYVPMVSDLVNPLTLPEIKIYGFAIKRIGAYK
ncbi:MAG: hypothetical protein K9N34_06380 [Candidatus Marinimicrobia bacterium]|nr:hypothetical protein [Candidatus Neomarinimicrobiota bacterium]